MMPEVTPEQHTILTIEVAGPTSALRSVMESADGTRDDPFLNFLAYLHAVTQNFSISIRSAFMEDTDDE